LRKSKKKEDTFEETLLKAIDEGLSVLGETVKDTLLFFIDKNFNLKKKDIPKKLKEFSSGLREIYGEFGSSFLEDQILKSLYKKLGLKYTRNRYLTFVDQIEEAYKTYTGKL